MYVRVIAADEVVRGKDTPDAIRINKLRGKVMRVLGQYAPKRVEVLPGLYLEAQEYVPVEGLQPEEFDETFLCPKCTTVFDMVVRKDGTVQCPNCGHEWRVDD